MKMNTEKDTRIKKIIARQNKAHEFFRFAHRSLDKFESSLERLPHVIYAVNSYSPSVALDLQDTVKIIIECFHDYSTTLEFAEILNKVILELEEENEFLTLNGDNVLN